MFVCWVLPSRVSVFGVLIMSLKLLEFSDHVVLYDAAANHEVEADIRSGPTTLLGVAVDLDANVAFLKLYDNANPTAGTTEPVDIIPFAASVNGYVPFGKDGVLFSNGLSFIVTSDDGKDATAPAGTVKLAFYCT